MDLKKKIAITVLLFRKQRQTAEHNICLVNPSQAGCDFGTRKIVEHTALWGTQHSEKPAEQKLVVMSVIDFLIEFILCQI